MQAVQQVALEEHTFSMEKTTCFSVECFKYPRVNKNQHRCHRAGLALGAGIVLRLLLAQDTGMLDAAGAAKPLLLFCKAINFILQSY